MSRPVAAANVAASSARSTDQTSVTHLRSCSVLSFGHAGSTVWPSDSSARAASSTAARTSGAVSTPKNDSVCSATRSGPGAGPGANGAT